MGQHALGIALAHDDAVVGAGQLHIHTVDTGDLRHAAADALTADLHRHARGVGDGDVHGVGVRGAYVGQRFEGEREPCLLGIGEGIADAQVVGFHAQQAGHQGTVGAVSGMGMREAAVQLEHGVHRFASQKFAAQVGDAQRAGGMAAGGAHHDGADDVADSDGLHGRFLSRGFPDAESMREESYTRSRIVPAWQLPRGCPNLHS